VRSVHDGEGVCLWLTGMSGAGKTTVTNELVPMLEQRGRVVTVLDVVPELAKHWGERTSEGKLIRKAYVAREVARHGGIAICVTVSARADVRARAQALVGRERFVEVYFDTPRQLSQRRKTSRSKRAPFIKRVRRRARRLRSLGRTGPSYQPPESPAVVLNTTATFPQDDAKIILAFLEERGFVASRGHDSSKDAAESGQNITSAAAQRSRQ